MEEFEETRTKKHLTGEVAHSFEEFDAYIIAGANVKEGAFTSFIGAENKEDLVNVLYTLFEAEPTILEAAKLAMAQWPADDVFNCSEMNN